jgi:hypothetical protein
MLYNYMDEVKGEIDKLEYISQKGYAKKYNGVGTVDIINPKEDKPKMYNISLLTSP